MSKNCRKIEKKTFKIIEHIVKIRSKWIKRIENSWKITKIVLKWVKIDLNDEK